jgi:hypothetical protein
MALLPPDAGPRRIEAARNVINRGWPSLAASELWLLLLLAACIGVFVVWWFLLALPAAGWALARLLDRLDPFPRTMDWYLKQFLRQAARSRIRARAEGDEAAEARIVTLMAEMEACLPGLGPEPVLPRRR